MSNEHLVDEKLYRILKTLEQIRDTFSAGALAGGSTPSGNIPVAIREDALGLARDLSLQQIRDALSKFKFDQNGNLLVSAGSTVPVQIAEDYTGLAKDSTLQSILSKLDVNLSTRASETTLQQIRDILSSSLTTAGNFKIAITEDSLGLARDSSLQTIISKLGGGLPSSLTLAGNLKVAIAEDTLGIARDSTLSNLSGKFPAAVALADNLSNPTTTLIGAALLGWDPASNVWRRIQVDSQGRLRAVFG